MYHVTAFIGFGEAGRAFAWPNARAFDRKTDVAGTRAAKLADYREAGVDGFGMAAEAVGGAALILSLVTADQALAAAREYAPLLDSGAFWLDMNSVAPATKREAANAIEAAGARYVDVAVMAPVMPARRSVPLLVSGPDARLAAQQLGKLGFTDVTIVGSRVGDASAIKMIRSVMVKGMEALGAECMAAAHRAGVVEPVLASLAASWKEQSWADRIDYNLDRMLAHGERRAAEMEEAAATLEDFGVDPVMTRATIVRQRELARPGEAAPQGLHNKLDAIDRRSGRTTEGKAA